MVGPNSYTGETDPHISAARAVPGCLEIRAYRILTRLAKPAAPYILRFRERKGKEDPSRRGERLGQASIVRPDGPVVWVHAASVGETSAVLPLLSRLAEQRPELVVLLTTGTVTSARFAASRLGQAMLHQYVPLDEPSFVAAFLDYWRPSLGIFTEQEVWPNLVLAASSRGIPLALVNARMSDRSFERWQRHPAVAAALFSRFHTVLAQNERLAARFAQIGAPNVVAVGNLKIDAPPPPVDAAAFAALQQALGGRPCIVAASTHEGEEQALCEAFNGLKQRIGGLLMMIAPRHPERGGIVTDLARGVGLAVGQRSRGAMPGMGTDIYVADSIGELGTLYAASPVAFIGGSLIPHGGQNPIEAVRHGAVVVTGPSIHNFADAYEALLSAQGAVRVEGADQISQEVGDLLANPERAERMRGNALRALSSLSGALDRTAAALFPLLPENERRRAMSGG
ncbi:MAG: 3-deoxy-D-manno-octulosonic acid transferase [Hyphomicrobiaceae bacterium]